jgi:hypothetical protein
VKQLPTYVFDCCVCVGGMHMPSFLVEQEGTDPQMGGVDVYSLDTQLQAAKRIFRTFRSRVVHLPQFERGGHVIQKVCQILR